jgi:hypothetical protein
VLVHVKAGGMYKLQLIVGFKHLSWAMAGSRRLEQLYGFNDTEPERRLQEIPSDSTESILKINDS